MKKIREIIIGTNNKGKYKEICHLLPRKIKKFSPKELGIISLYSYFWRLKTGRLKYNRKILNRFDEK